MRSTMVLFRDLGGALGEDLEPSPFGGRALSRRIEDLLPERIAIPPIAIRAVSGLPCGLLLPVSVDLVAI